MKTIYLISCTKLKQSYFCSVEEMYKPSLLFQTSFKYALKNVKDKYSQIYILSAEYHLLSLSDKIYPYDKTLNTMTKLERSEWGKKIYSQLTDLFDTDKTKFIVLAGKNYIESLLPYLKNIENPIPIKYRNIGKRIKWMKDIIYENKELIEAKNIRILKNKNKIPKNMPGWYKWWAPEESLKKLLNSNHISEKYFEFLLPYLTSTTIKNKKYYYIYVGVAIKESIHNRLNWHVNQKHTKSSIESGFLSTLRQTLSSLIAGNQYDEDATNLLIDTLIIEYYSINLPIKSDEAKIMIEKIEKTEIDDNVLPLNIKGNKNLLLKEFLKELSGVRKKSKNNSNQC